MANGNGFTGARDANGNFLTVEEINRNADVPTWLRAHIEHERFMQPKRKREAEEAARQEKVRAIQQAKWDAALKEFEKLPLETRKALYELLGGMPSAKISPEMMKKLGLK